MDWNRQIDGYCERLDPGLWAEPLNAVTNAAFLIAAFVMWRRVNGQGMAIARLLCVLLALIGVSSGLFHTHAVVWTAMMDSLSILAFVLVYLYAANRDFWLLPVWSALGATVLFIPFTAVLVPLFQLVPGLGGSAVYAPLPVLIVLYAIGLRHRAPETAQGLALGAGVLIVSLIMRSTDEPACAALPFGTHFAWHLLNGLMLGWMIEVYRRHKACERSIARVNAR